RRSSSPLPAAAWRRGPAAPSSRATGPALPAAPAGAPPARGVSGGEAFRSLQRASRPRRGLLALGERLAVPRPDDEWFILHIIEMRRVGGLVAADAPRRGDLRAHVAAGLVLDVLAARPVTSLALHVLPSHGVSFDARLAYLRAI